MKINVIRFALAVMLMAGVSASLSGCAKKGTDIPSGGTLTPKPTPTPTPDPGTKGEWINAADSTSTAFIDRFFCSTSRNGFQGVFSYGPYNQGPNNGNCYWQQAHAMASMVDYYLRIKDSNPALKTKIEGYFQAWFDKKGNNYEGNKSWRGNYGFGNDFTDDTCWITVALLQMYDATGKKDYYDAAKGTWDDCVWPRSNSAKNGGWLPWKMTAPNDFNCCTNGPGAIAAAMLSAYAKKNGETADAAKYLDQAKICFSQNIADAKGRNGCVGEPPLSYTQGTCMEAGRLIWRLTGDQSYLDHAVLAAKAQMTSNRVNTTHNNQMVARHEGDDENNSIFHAVFFHWAARMATDKDIDAYHKDVRKDLKTYVGRHAKFYWSEGIDKKNWERSYFSVLCYEPRPMNSGSLGAYTSAAQCFEAMCIMDKQ